ncbi:MAG: 4'-phosphopantetheinyl transferase superfamily protein [Myxococcota bacterium]
MSRALLPLDSNQADLWLLPVDGTATPESPFWAWLHPTERARHQRYLFPRNRDEFLLTRALVRSTLSRYVEVDPAAWVFRTNEHGRPEIAEPRVPLRFNLSNTQGLIACAVAWERDVGVDVENSAEKTDVTSIAGNYFSPQEVSSLFALPWERQRTRFFEFWTLKEAYIKARGMGLAIPLDQFSFLVADDAPIQVALDPRLGDDATTWQFALLRPASDFFAALAIRRGHGADLGINVRHVRNVQDLAVAS